MITITSQISRQTTWRDMLDFDPPVSGDVIQMTLKNGESLICEVAHDENGKLFLVFQNCLEEEMPMNKSNTNRGGWKACDMRKYARRVFELFPDDLQAVIQPTKIVQVINGERIECQDKLFCLSIKQVFGSLRGWDDVDPEDSQLDIFKNRKNRFKLIGGAASYWWTRSPYVTYSTYFGVVGTTGGYGNGSGAASSYGVCFGFCIGEAIL